jgi:hypothetical protein
MKFLQWLWKVLDGNKTWICAALVAVLSQPFIQQFMSAGLNEFLIWLFAALGGLSLAHKVKKGHLTAEKGH